MNVVSKTSKTKPQENPEPVASKRYAPGESPIEKWRASLTPEQKAEFHRKAGERSAQARIKQNTDIAEATAKAKELLPELIAQKMLLEDSGADYKPSMEILGQIRGLMEKGLTIEKMRQGAFRQLQDKTWQKLLKFLFKDQIAQVEDVGLELINKKREFALMLKKRTRLIRKEIKLYTNAKNPVPPSLLKVLSEAEDRLMEIELDTANTMHRIGAVGEKSKSAAINIYTNTPRPKPASEEARVVSGVTEVVGSAVRSLNDVLEGK